MNNKIFKVEVEINGKHICNLFRHDINFKKKILSNYNEKNIYNLRLKIVRNHSIKIVYLREKTIDNLNKRISSRKN